MSKEAMKLALKRAFQYGADHWYQADHDSYKENKKADKTLEEFRRFVDETCEALAEQPAQPSKPWVGLTDDEILYCVELENPKAIAEEVEAKLKEKNT